MENIYKSEELSQLFFFISNNNFRFSQNINGEKRGIKCKKESYLILVFIKNVEICTKQ